MRVDNLAVLSADLDRRMLELTAPATTGGRFEFITPAQLVARRAEPQLIVGAMPSKGLAIVAGQSGSGKTFAVLDALLAVTRGIPWASRRVLRGKVVYVAAEGNLQSRIRAYCEHHRIEPADLAGFYVLDRSINLLDPHADIDDLLIDLAALRAHVGPIAAVCIDTLNRVMPGGNENASEDMGAVIAAAKLIEDGLGCVVVFVHHHGKDETRGSRGHSSLKAAADCEWSVRRDGDIRTVAVEKLRDGRDGETLMAFSLQPVDLGPLSDVDPGAEPDEHLTSCVVVPAEAPPTASTGPRLTPTAKIALDALRSLLQASGERTPGSSVMPAGKPFAGLDAWRDRFRSSRGQSDAGNPQERGKDLDASRKAFDRAREQLIAARIVGVHEQTVWLW